MILYIHDKYHSHFSIIKICDFIYQDTKSEDKSKTTIIPQTTTSTGIVDEPSAGAERKTKIDEETWISKCTYNIHFK